MRLTPAPPAARQPVRYWTQRELALLEQHYRRGGLTAATAALPHRTQTAIYQQATQKLGIRLGRRNVHGGWWVKTAQVDEAIRKAYEQPHGKRDLDALARRLGRPSWWLGKRATQLGLQAPRFNETAWTTAEIDLLHQTAHLSSSRAWREFKRHGFTRSETAIVVKRKREACKPVDNGYYTATSVATLLGIGCAKTLIRSINSGELKATRRGTARTDVQGGDHWWIAERDLRAFIAAHPLRIDLRKIPASSATWFITLLANNPL